MARPEGFQPPTLGSEDQCSMQLSYGRTDPFYSLIFCSKNRNRELILSGPGLLGIPRYAEQLSSDPLFVSRYSCCGQGLRPLEVRGRRLTVCPCRVRYHAAHCWKRLRLPVTSEGLIPKDILTAGIYESRPTAPPMD
jgi:hypothetical protein